MSVNLNNPFVIQKKSDTLMSNQSNHVGNLLTVVAAFLEGK